MCFLVLSLIEHLSYELFFSFLFSLIPFSFSSLLFLLPKVGPKGIVLSQRWGDGPMVTIDPNQEKSCALLKQNEYTYAMTFS